MVTQKIKELEATKLKLAALEQSIADEMNRELASLPGKFGFESVQAFVKAVKAASKGGRARRKAQKGKRTRAVITPETKAKVKELVQGGKTGTEIAKALKISLPSVQNIKKEFGLVKARK